MDATTLDLLRELEERLKLDPRQRPITIINININGPVSIHRPPLSADRPSDPIKE